MSPIQKELDIISEMTLKYEKYLSSYEQGGDWDMWSFMDSIHRRTEKIKTLLKAEPMKRVCE